MDNKGECVVEDVCIQNLAGEIAQEWQDLGRRLGLKDPELQRLKSNFSTQEEINYQMLLLWLKKKASQATYNELAKALQLAQRVDLAEKLLRGEFDASDDSQVSTSISQRASPGPSSSDTQPSATNTARVALPCYKMEGKLRGTCLILTYDDFKGDKKWSRRGNDVDEKKLKETFETLGFDVDYKRNRNSSETKQLIQEKALKRHFDSFAFFVCSHGDEDGFYASDKEKITIQEIITLFKVENCQSFASKPKMFFFNHCRGDEKERMVEFQADSGSTQRGVAANNYRPNEADFCILSSTVSGYVSWRNTTKGSYFVQNLCASLQEYYETHHLFDILLISNDTLINKFEEIRRESNDSSSICQVPHLLSTLTKAVYFVDEQR